MAWFKKKRTPLQSTERRDVPTDVFTKCDGCGEIIYRERLSQNLEVCPTCGFHFRIDAEAYIELLIDEGSFDELDTDLRAADPLRFVDLKRYSDRIQQAEAKGQDEAVITGTGTLSGIALALAVMDFRYIGGSMGSVVGEKIARLSMRSLERKYPLIIVSASGGARMQEGVLSLMQMA